MLPKTTWKAHSCWTPAPGEDRGSGLVGSRRAAPGGPTSPEAATGRRSLKAGF